MPAKRNVCGHDPYELLKLTEPRILASRGGRLLIVLAIDEAELQAAIAGLAFSARALRADAWLPGPE
jgi:hypothetical protein